MKRFVFRLEKVKQWRESQATLQAMRVGVVQNELARLERETRQIQIEMDAARVHTQNSSGTELQAIDAFHRKARTELRQATTKSEYTRSLLKRELDSLRALRASARVLEALRERSFDQWRVEGEKEVAELALESARAVMARAIQSE